MAILETKNLTYTYGAGTPFEKTAVENVNLSVEKGAFVGVIGHTGSGKSTLIQMLNGLIRPTSGQVLLNGEDIWTKPKEIRRVRFQVGMAGWEREQGGEICSMSAMEWSPKRRRKRYGREWRREGKVAG